MREESSWESGGRVLALSDGVFAIAATLLALDIRVPADLGHAELLGALRALLPSLLGYAISFLVIGVLWLGHHELFGSIRRGSQPVAAANIVLLALVALLPFSSSVLADYGDEPVVVITYAANVAAIACSQLVIVAIAARGGSLRDPVRWALAPSAVTAGIFLLSMPVALAAPQWATTSWVLLVPAHAALGRLERRSA
ncbi:TMEM175 family protein [Saccharopolyspora sp. NPDC000359]|uniref:TMEM175 family protein n=1 Tax=Saccharopolyspora sp. NPDC000359 TaxID=3154251 RepID=UPI00331E30B8